MFVVCGCQASRWLLLSPVESLCVAGDDAMDHDRSGTDLAVGHVVGDDLADAIGRLFARHESPRCMVGSMLVARHHDVRDPSIRLWGQVEQHCGGAEGRLIRRCVAVAGVDTATVADGVTSHNKRQGRALAAVVHCGFEGRGGRGTWSANCLPAEVRGAVRDEGAQVGGDIHVRFTPEVVPDAMVAVVDGAVGMFDHVSVVSPDRGPCRLRSCESLRAVDMVTAAWLACASGRGNARESAHERRRLAAVADSTFSGAGAGVR
jgi:hypothetical protein